MKKLLDPATNKYYWWYPQSEIDFNRDQMLFLIENYGYLAENRYPTVPTGYIEVKTFQGRAGRAANMTPVELKAELDARLQTVSRDAKEALFDEVQAGTDTYEMLSRPAKRALNYISGWKRRRTAFSQWCYAQKEKGRK